MKRLSKKYDCLRSKELSFGCFVNLEGYDSQKNKYTVKNGRITSIWRTNEIFDVPCNDIYFKLLGYSGDWGEDCISETIGRPLTLGRLCELAFDHFTVYGGDITNQYQCIMYDLYFIKLVGKDELEWVKHEKRDNIKTMLDQFVKMYKSKKHSQGENK